MDTTGAKDERLLLEARKLHEVGIGDVVQCCDDNNPVVLSSGSVCLGVGDMETGVLYKTLKGRYRCRVTGKPDPIAEQIRLWFYEGEFQHCWLSCMVDREYPVIPFLDEDGHVHYHNDQSRGQEHGASSPRSKREGGRITGGSMLECWGLYFRQCIKQPGGRKKIVEAMIREFPDKHARIERWVDSYRSYFNLGKLPGCYKQEIKLPWVLEVGNDPLANLLEG